MATARIYGQAALSLFNKEIDWVDDTIKCGLVTNTYTPNLNTHRYWSDVTGEATGTGYTAGGVVVTGKTLLWSPTYSYAYLDCDNPGWTTVTVTFRYAIFYASTGTASTSPLIAYVDYGSHQVVTATNLNLIVPVAGLAQLTVA